ncbi:hypothetical protein C8Q73DRAFT_214787 [Cubamyces lactineus]|nr:hypothetical protein C8Q73DRAFT_214787 [Cubamyces lactineus]
MEYKIRTVFRRCPSITTVTNFLEMITGLQMSSPPILLLYGMADDKADLPSAGWSWFPHTDDSGRLCISTLAITRDAFIEKVILPQLALYNQVTALVPTAQLACDYPCPSAVYLRPSGNGSKATAMMWTPLERAEDPFSQTYLFQDVYCAGEVITRQGPTPDNTDVGVADSDPPSSDVVAQHKLYTCKTVNKLTISDNWAVTMAGSVELYSNDPAR